MEMRASLPHPLPSPGGRGEVGKNPYSGRNEGEGGTARVERSHDPWHYSHRRPRQPRAGLRGNPAQRRVPFSGRPAIRDWRATAARGQVRRRPGTRDDRRSAGVAAGAHGIHEPQRPGAVALRPVLQDCAGADAGGARRAGSAAGGRAAQDGRWGRWPQRPDRHH